MEVRVQGAKERSLFLATSDRHFLTEVPMWGARPS